MGRTGPDATARQQTPTRFGRNRLRRLRASGPRKQSASGL